MELTMIVLVYGLYGLVWLAALPFTYGTVWVIVRAVRNAWH